MHPIGSCLILLPPTNNLLETRLITKREEVRHFSCNVDQIGASVGLDLVVATALVRTLRIYHIFHHFGKQRKDWTDSRLVAVVVAIISIKVCLFVLWISVDNQHLTDTIIFQGGAVPPYYLVIQSCYSNYQALWAASAYMFTFSLLVLLLFLAIKTRKTSLGDFKDTKILTVLVVFFNLVLIVFGSLWGILRLSGQPIASYVSLALAYSLSSFAIQVSLFLPKVLPPLYRHLKNCFE